MGEFNFVAVLTTILIVSAAVGWKVRPLVWGCFGLSLFPFLLGIIGYVLYRRDLASDSNEARDWAVISFAFVLIGVLILQGLVGIGWGIGWAAKAISAGKHKTNLKAGSAPAADAPNTTESHAETPRSCADNSC